MSDASEMVSAKSPDWLPAGWTEHVNVRKGRKVKCYIDPLTGHKFYSKPQVSEYVMRNSCTSEQEKTGIDTVTNPNMGTLTGDEASVKLDESQNVKTRKRLSSTSKHNQTSLDNGSVHGAVIERVTPEGLPEGWIKEIRIQKNAFGTKRYPCYIDPLTGRKFYSKPQVSEYLKRNSCISQQEKIDTDSVANSKMDTLTGEEASLKLEESQNVKTRKRSSSTSKQKQKSSEKGSIHKAVTKRVTPEGLPAGWIKEVKIQKNANGTRKDPFYTDPVSGFVFFSQKDALRYLETGDWSKCAKRPRKKEELAEEPPLNKEEITRAETSVKLEKSENVKTVKRTRRESKQKQTSLGKQSVEKLNNGEITRAETSLELGEPHEVKSAKRMSRRSKQKQTSLGKQSVEKVAISKVSADGLPPGWIKEIRIGRNGSRRDPFYTDPVSGYAFCSQKDVLRYLETGDIRKCMKKPRKRNELGSLNKDTSGSPDLDELTEAKSPMKLEGAQNMKNLKRKSCASQKQMGFKKRPVEKVVIERVPAGGLPPGWIKEIRVQKNGVRTRKDPYYTDPVTGYVFRSEKDALRYLESGDITSCTMKPKKRDELGFLNDETSPNTCEITGAISSVTPEPSHSLESLKHTSCDSKQEQMRFTKQSIGEVVIERVTPHELPTGWIKEIRIQKKAHGTRKDPYYTDPVSGYVFRSQQDALRYIETGDITKCAIKPKKRDELGFLNEETSLPPPPIKQKFGPDTTRRQLFVGTENIVTSCLGTTDAESSQKKRCICASLEAMITTETSCSSMPRSHGSKRKRGVKVSAQKGTKELGMEGNRNRKKQTNSRKSENEEEQRLPSRSSKRLAGIKRDLSSNEQALASGKSGDGEAKPSPQAIDNLSHSAPEQFQTVSETQIEIQDLDLREPEVPSNVELPECIMKLFEDQPIPEDQLVRTESEKREEENPGVELRPSGDSWSDPCLEFAYKTLTDTIPVQESLPGQGYFQQQGETSHAQTDGCSAPPGYGVPYFFQNNISPHVVEPVKPVSAPQFPTNFTFLPHGDVSRPSSGDNAPQEPNLEGTNEHQTNVNWPWM